MICIKLRAFLGAFCAAAATLVAPAASAQQPQRLDAITLNAGMHNIRAEVAATPAERQQGLMFRRDLAQHEGMLFVFQQAATQCFWMRNTPTPLSIAFLRDDGSVANILDMAPHSEAQHCSAEPVRYALEMNQGWFAKRGVKPGFKLKGAPFDGAPAR
jgi:uncharacterized membrane protein (UPF0127 family)